MDQSLPTHRQIGPKKAGWLGSCCRFCVLLLLSLTGPCAQAQSASADPAFEVASIKPVLVDAAHPFDARHFGPRVNATGASYQGMTVRYLLAYAYGVEFIQVTGPEWTRTDRFDIEARFPEGTAEQDQKRMLQALLKDRFQLGYHIENRELDGYALMVGKHGAKLKPPLPEPALSATSAKTTSKAVEASPKVTRNPDGSSTFSLGQRGTQTTRFDAETMTQHWELSKATMADLAQRLAVCVDSTYHKVVDQTGLQGEYQVAFDCPVPGRAHRVSASPIDAASDPQGDPLGKSLEALGLKLEKRRTPADVYVIDHVEKPSEN